MAVFNYYRLSFDLGSSEPCDDGWVFNAMNHQCYQLSDSKLHADMAERRCVEVGGHLASVSDERENTFLTSML